jgi:hypothetical protein
MEFLGGQRNGSTRLKKRKADSAEPEPWQNRGSKSLK